MGGTFQNLPSTNNELWGSVLGCQLVKCSSPSPVEEHRILLGVRVLQLEKKSPHTKRHEEPLRFSCWYEKWFACLGIVATEASGTLT